MHARDAGDGPDEQRMLIQALLEAAAWERETGEYPAARSLLDEALHRSVSSLGDTDPDTATVLNALGVWSRYYGDIPLARACYTGALVITGSSGHSGDAIDVLHNLANA